MLDDLRRALRSLWRQPGFTALSVAILALGLGASVTMFSLVSTLVLRALPYPEPDRLVQLERRSAAGLPSGAHSAADLLAYRQQSQVFEAVAAYAWQEPVLEVPGQAPVSVWGVHVSAGFLDVLKVKPRLGRGFFPDEDRAGNDQVSRYRHFAAARGSHRSRPGVRQSDSAARGVVHAAVSQDRDQRRRSRRARGVPRAQQWGQRATTALIQKACANRGAGAGIAIALRAPALSGPAQRNFLPRHSQRPGDALDPQGLIDRRVGGRQHARLRLGIDPPPVLEADPGVHVHLHERREHGNDSTTCSSGCAARRCRSRSDRVARRGRR